MSVTRISHSLVVNENGTPIIENGKILLVNREDNALIYVTLTDDIKTVFDLEFAETSTEHIENEFETNVEAVDEIDELLLTNANEQDDGDTPLIAKDGEKFVWTNKSILLFLDEYKAKLGKFRNPKVKKKILWDHISVQMRKKGYEVDADALDRKMRNMKKTYRTILDNNNKKKTTGTGRIHWEYFSYFEDMLQEDKTVNLPSNLITSTQLSNITSKRSEPDTFDDNSSNSRTSTPGRSDCELTQHSKSHQIRRLDVYRKRQLEIEEEKLLELKKLREGIAENNKLQKEKIELLKKMFERNHNK